MIRFTLLRFRVQAAVAAGGLLIVAVILAVTGPHLAHVYAATLRTCTQQGNCALALSTLPPSPDGALRALLDGLIVAVPGLTGMFWGAPLAARELEAGTFRLAWTQGITRTRWLAAKLAVIGAASMLTAGLLSLMVTWWASPIETAGMDRITPGVFHSGGIVPVGYAAFAFTLGVTAGLLTRRTLPAIAITLVIFAAVQLAVPAFLRPQLITPVHASSPLAIASITEMGTTNAGAPGGGSLFVQAQPDIPGAWILSSDLVTPAGRPANTLPAGQACSENQSRQACKAYIAGFHLRHSVTYQPGSRYWALQWYETAIYLAAALILAGLCFLRIRPRRPARRGTGRARESQPVLARQGPS
ncbi:MAG TPA: ABC transporter permease [Trebonia sp.]|nr:ABC transporter permease [Trebonia sp.]